MSRPPATTDDLRQRLIAALRTVRDPELPVDIWSLGLVYDLHVAPDGTVRVRMTLTTPNCPVAGSIPGQVRQRLLAVQGVADAHVELVWDPPWRPERMSEEARLVLETSGVALPDHAAGPRPTRLTIGRRPGT